METEKSYLRVNLNSREIEICGGEEFVEGLMDKLDDYYQFLSRENELAHSREVPVNDGTNKVLKKVKPGSFAEYYQRLYSGATKAEKILLAAYYSQLNSPDGAFKTLETSRLLKAQNVRLSNPSQYILMAVKNNKVEQVQRGRYRLTTEGIEEVTRRYLLNTEGNTDNTELKVAYQ